jgi:hypothetical protein
MFMDEDGEIIKTQCGMWETMVETQIEWVWMEIL